MAQRRTPPDDSATTVTAGGGPAPGAVPVAVRVRPGAGRSGVGGRYDGPHGPALIVAVAAPANRRRATEAVRRAPADAPAVRPAEVAPRLGATSRDKVAVDAAVIGERLTAPRDGLT